MVDPSRRQRKRPEPAPYSPEDLRRIARRWELYSARALVANGLSVFAIGAIFGALVSTGMGYAYPGHFRESILAAASFGASLTALWIPMALIALFAARRMDRFDLRVQSALERRDAVRRSVHVGIALLALAFLAILPGISDHTDTIVRSAWIGLVVIIALAITASAVLKPAHHPIDWSRSNLCRRCGYDRGETLTTCPECGEEAPHA